MTDQTCPRCQSRTRDALCPRCVRRAEHTLRDLPGLAAEVETTITRQARAGRGPGARTKGHEQPLPYADSPRIDEARLWVDTLTQWARHVSPNDPVAPYPRRDLLGATRTAAVVLLASIDYLRRAHDADALAETIDGTRLALRRAVDRRAVRIFAGPCDQTLTGPTMPGEKRPKCDADLYAHPGRDTITCPECRHVHTAVSRNRFLRDALEDRLLTLDEILPALPWLIGKNPTRAAVGMWRTRQKLVPKDHTARGVPLYRGGDVIDLALDGKPGPRPAAHARHERDRATLARDGVA